MANVRTDENIRIVSADEAGIKTHIPQVPVSFFAWGNLSLLDRPRAAVLNSRKSRRVSPDDLWLKVTERCVREAVEQGYTVVSSLGAMTYNWVTFLAKKLSARLIIVCDDVLPWMQNERKSNAFFETYGDLFDPDLTLFLSPFGGDRLPSAKERGPVRDACIAALSHKLWIAEIRSNGNMSRLVDRCLNAGAVPEVVMPDQKIFSETFGETGMREDLEQQPRACKKSISAASDSPSLNHLPVIDPNLMLEDRYLTHFTRACPGPWPGQTMHHYLEALLMRRQDAGHTAFDTLLRILMEQSIRGSSRLVRGPESVVSFTASTPKTVLEMVRWNRALVRWSFEPYGIAISKQSLFDAGAVPVLYISGDKYAGLSPEERFRFQIYEPPAKDWTKEKEWRIKGDLRLNIIPKKEVVIILPGHEQEPWREAQLDYPVTFI